MVTPTQRFDRLETEILRYHAPKATEGMGGAVTMEVRTIMLTEIIRDLDLKGREAQIQRAYTKFCTLGLMARSGFGFRLTDKGVEAVKGLKSHSML